MSGIQTAAVPEPDALLGTTLEGGVHLTERIGDSAIGPLYRAEAFLDRHEVGVLVLSAPLGDEQSASAGGPLRDQLRQALSIHHPNLAGIEALGELPDGRSFVVLELLAGELLSDLLRDGRAPRPREAVDLVLQAAAGLEAAHETGLVHGNLSPASLLVRRARNRAVVKIVGFALDATSSALATDRASASPTAVSGAASAIEAYLPPERAAGAPASRAGDVYGLAAILRHLITGDPLGGTRALPRHLEPVLNRALAADPEGRFQSAGEFANALRAAAGEPARRRQAAMRRGVVAALPVAAIVAAAIWVPWGAIATSMENVWHSIGRRTAASAEIGLATDSLRGVDSESPREPPPPALPPATTRSAAAPVARPVPVPSSAADSVTRVSPFRRRYPWAAAVGGRTYFPSGCGAALGARELVYFRTEAAARREGRTRSRDPGCS